MESHYNYFNRDISWLSFNHRVLLEADDDTLPLFERINFIAIYSSNLEEFYQVRVAEHKAVASGGKSEDMTVDEAHALIRQITDTVNRQLEDRVRIYEEKILPALRRNHVVFYQSKSEVEDFHKEFVHRFFMEEVFPYIQPVKIDPENVRFFLRDRRLYLAVKVWKDAQEKPEYYIIKMPYSKVPRFVQLPSHEGNYYLMFLEDIIKANLKEVFIGYEVECSYCCKISRDADVFVDDVPAESMVEKLKEKVKKRKIGAICRFVYDRKMPGDFLDALVEALGINREELVPGDKHLNLEDLASLPNPNPDIPAIVKPQPMFLPGMNEKHFMYRRIAKRDMLLYYPYHSFEHFIHFLYEAVHDPFCREIMITQYRVAEHSEVINALIAAARNGKHVTVFVELKARFDEENNIEWSRLLERAGCHVVYGIEGLKVHSKLCLITRKTKDGISFITQIGTGNYNEKTSRLYTDLSFLTASREIGLEATEVFRALDQGETVDSVKNLLVAPHCLQNRLLNLIDGEIEAAARGEGGYIGIKINSLTDKVLINKLIEASQAGVHIDMVVRGICCLRAGVPDETDNIHIISIVGRYLEHSRIYILGRGERARYYIGSADWMTRSTLRRVEIAAPVTAPALKARLQHIFNTMLADNSNARVQQPDGSYVRRMPGADAVDCQAQFYEEAYQANVHSDLK